VIPPLAARRADPFVAVAIGCGLLLARPIVRAGPAPRLSLTVLYVVLLAAGVMLSPRRGRLLPVGGSWPAVLAAGVAAFGLGRVVAGGHAAAWARDAVALDALAAIAEEAFFRRFAYDALLVHGERVAVAGSVVLFALVHLTVYGWWAMPIDVAAGLVLSWQRRSTGSWGVPAFTHVAANVLMRL
jgi:membrane protease YdiL (CAAX protease family)